jgi:hypothetical protein
MNEKLQGAIACTAFVVGMYAIYVGGTLYSGAPMPDGPLFAGMLTVIGAIFGYKFRPEKAVKKP